MSFKDTVLPASMIVSLYRKVLVSPVIEVSLGAPSNKQIEQPPIKFLGNNAKKIVIVVNHPSEVFLPDRHLDFLTKMLSACKLNLGDVAILNQGSEFVGIDTINTHLQPRQLILFGVDPTEIRLPMSFPHFKILQYADSAYLSAPSLDLLNMETEEGKLLKTRLWVCLKSLFEVSNQK